jgi:5-methylcytosine-specific restriction endonuclease McrA
MILNITDVWEKAAQEHENYVRGRILKFEPKITSPYLRQLIERKKETIISGKPNELHQLIYFCNSLLHCCSEEEYEIFIQECHLVFDYDAFAKKRERTYKGWSAYRLCQKSKYLLCPYCQQNFAFTIVGENGGSFRPTLDHFFPKAEYPYLALSLYNLVPACQVCNSSLKGSKNFFHFPHLHPFKDEETVEFYLDPLDTIEYRKSGKYNIELKVRFPGNAEHRNSVNLFLLSERYAIHAESIQVFLENVEYWFSTGKKMKESMGLPDYFHERHALSFNLANYKNELLGKIKKDLYLQMRAFKEQD